MTTCTHFTYALVKGKGQLVTCYIFFFAFILFRQIQLFVSFSILIPNLLLSYTSRVLNNVLRTPQIIFIHFFFCHEFPLLLFYLLYQLCYYSFSQHHSSNHFNLFSIVFSVMVVTPKFPLVYSLIIILNLDTHHTFTLAF